MALLLDLFGFLSVVLRGLTLTAQSLTVGGVAFILILVGPLAGELGACGITVTRRCRTLLGWSAIALAIVAPISILVERSILAATVDLTAAETIGAAVVRAASVVLARAIRLAWASRHNRDGLPP